MVLAESERKVAGHEQDSSSHDLTCLIAFDLFCHIIVPCHTPIITICLTLSYVGLFGLCDWICPNIQAIPAIIGYLVRFQLVAQSRYHRLCSIASLQQSDMVRR